MTTSRTDVATPVRSRGGARAGFTLIELLITISIIATLFTILAVAGGGYQKRARVENTKGMISRLELDLDRYKSKAGNYPPDGLDGKKVYSEDDTQLMSGAALTYALSHPIQLTKKQPDGTMKPIGTAEAVSEFKAGELVDFSERGIDLHDDGVGEVCDAWGEPFHYDCLRGGRDSYSRQDTSEVHLANIDIGYEDIDDPRTFEGIAVRLVGPQNLGEFDIWSHGPNGHDPVEDFEAKTEEVIANWNLPTEQEAD